MERYEVNDYSIESYVEFLRIKRMPLHRVERNIIHFENLENRLKSSEIDLNTALFDYERFIVRLALAKKRFAVFADVGLGKTFIFLEWLRHVSSRIAPKKALIISQIHLTEQTSEEQVKFYGESNLCDINAVFRGDIEAFLGSGAGVGIVNVDKFNRPFRLQNSCGAVVLDESSILKSIDGRRRTNLIDSCAGIEYRLCCTATPAPNDRQEYANHALFLGYIDNYKQFFTKFFYNTGSGNDFVMKPHAKSAFYAFLATFSIFLKSPSRYGFADNLQDLKPPQVIWDHIELAHDQRIAALKHGSKGQMSMFGVNVGGMTNRNKLSQIAKGFIYGDSDCKQQAQ